MVTQVIGSTQLYCLGVLIDYTKKTFCFPAEGSNYVCDTLKHAPLLDSDQILHSFIAKYLIISYNSNSFLSTPIRHPGFGGVANNFRPLVTSSHSEV